jgi:hemin uptake protein HemP
VFLGAISGRVLVPGHPKSAILCRYWGENDLPARSEDRHAAGTLAGALQITRQDVTSYLTSELDALRPISPRANCDEILGGRSDLIIFLYHSGTQARVRVTRAGCIPVTNGTITRGALAVEHGNGEVHWPDEALL